MMWLAATQDAAPEDPDPLRLAALVAPLLAAAIMITELLGPP